MLGILFHGRVRRGVVLQPVWSVWRRDASVGEERPDNPVTKVATVLTRGALLQSCVTRPGRAQRVVSVTLSVLRVKVMMADVLGYGAWWFLVMLGALQLGLRRRRISSVIAAVLRDRRILSPNLPIL